MSGDGIQYCIGAGLLPNLHRATCEKMLLANVECIYVSDIFKTKKKKNVMLSFMQVIEKNILLKLKINKP